MLAQLKDRLAELRQASNDAFAAWQQIAGRAEECAFLINWLQREEQDKAPADAGAASSGADVLSLEEAP